jgi:hypothetical protein
VAALLAALFLAACSGGSSTAGSAVTGAGPAPVTIPGPISRIAPGHGTPQEAVEGYAQAEFQGNWIRACSYASPDTQQACLRNTNAFGPNSSGQVTIDGADINGNYALVELTGPVCNEIAGCLSNMDPSSGMPTGPSGFQAAYDAALPSAPHSGPLIISPLPVIKVNGQWYVNYG